MTTLKKAYALYNLITTDQIIPSYYKDFDFRYMGLLKKRITFIAGRPLSGKTWLLCNMALNIARFGHKVLFITGNLRETTRRMFAICPNLPSLNLEEEVLLDAHKLQDLCLKHHPDVIFIDIHLLGNVINKKILRRFKQMAKMYNFALVMTGTLNRAIDTRTDNMPHTRDFCGIKEQTGVLETADNIFALYNPALYIPYFLLPKKHTLMIVPLKPTSMLHINLEFKKSGEIADWEPELKEAIN